MYNYAIKLIDSFFFFSRSFSKSYLYNDYKFIYIRSCDIREILLKYYYLTLENEDRFY